MEEIAIPEENHWPATDKHYNIMLHLVHLASDGNITLNFSEDMNWLHKKF